MEKVKAAILVEVLISMVIMMIVFTIAIGIFANITNSSFSVTEQRAQLIAKRIINESIDQKDWAETSVLIDGIEFKKTVKAYNGYSDLLEIQVEASSQQRSKGLFREIVSWDSQE